MWDDYGYSVLAVLTGAAFVVTVLLVTFGPAILLGHIGAALDMWRWRRKGKPNDPFTYAGVVTGGLITLLLGFPFLVVFAPWWFGLLG